MMAIISSARRAPPSCLLALRTAHLGVASYSLTEAGSGRILGHAHSRGRASELRGFPAAAGPGQVSLGSSTAPTSSLTLAMPDSRR